MSALFRPDHSGFPLLRKSTPISGATFPKSSESSAVNQPSGNSAAPTFSSLNLPDGLVRKLAQNKIVTPSPIQTAVIPDAA